jgi:hypothetical protein
MEDRISDEILNHWHEQLLGNLPYDEAIAAYDYSQVSEQTKACLGMIWRSLLTKVKAPVLAELS